MALHRSQVPLSLLFLLFVSRLPPLLHSRSIISELPGFHGRLPFYLETGYVVVDEEEDAQLFYYFVKSERDPEMHPLLLWMTGGPGCSALSGMTNEIGPIAFQKEEYNGSIPTLILNPYSWSKVSSIIFLDSPIGTGFSFSRSSGDYLVGDIISSKQVYKFLRKWLADHPEFLSNPLYISGDSYAGKVIPIITHLINEGIEARTEPIINLKGYLAGNPVVSELTVDMSATLMAYTFGLIPLELYESLKYNCKGQPPKNPTNVDCARDLARYDNILSGVGRAQVTEFECADETLKGALKEVHSDFHGSINPPDIRCTTAYQCYLCYQWANFEISRRALHVQEGTIGEWNRCDTHLPYERIPSSFGFYFNLTNKGYRGLIYSGDRDLLRPQLGTQEWIGSLNLPIVDDWRPWWVGSQLAGYTRAYFNNLTFATVKEGGHTAPGYEPKKCLAMISRWLSYVPL